MIIILLFDNNGLELFSYPGKSLFITQFIRKGQYIGEYRGRQLTTDEIDPLDEEYDDSYLYTFKHDGKWCG